MTKHNIPDLPGIRIAILATEGVEQVELTEPLAAFRAAGAAVDVVSPKTTDFRAWNRTEWGETVRVDRALDAARPEDYAALVLPGGVMNPDFLRLEGKAIAFVRAFAQANKPIAAICHGPWTLIDANAVKGRTMTSWPSLQTDLRNAGAEWVDKQVVVDRNLVTSRKPDDLPAFIAHAGEVIAQAAAHRKAAE